MIPPHVPHAYIKGELCECMINSDNVVRGGLTPKQKDISTLLQILPYHDTRDQLPLLPFSLSDDIQEYKPDSYEELRVYRVNTSRTDMVELPKFVYFAMIIVLEGGAETESGVDMPLYSTWYAMPGTTLKLRKKTGDVLTVFIANPCAKY